jgi:hypothetical protein
MYPRWIVRHIAEEMDLKTTTVRNALLGRPGPNEVEVRLVRQAMDRMGIDLMMYSLEQKIEEWEAAAGDLTVSPPDEWIGDGDQ